MTSVEIVHFPLSGKYRSGKIPNLPTELFTNLADCAASCHVSVRMTTPDRVRFDADWLMLYGPGGLDRRPIMQRQMGLGGHVICWDAPYWQRGLKLRMAIDHAHPQRHVMAIRRPALRRRVDHIEVRSCVPVNAHGWVLIAGIGPKALQQYGHDQVRAWENAMVASARLLWGSARKIVFRPKPNHDMPPPVGATKVRADVDLHEHFHCSSVVVTWHSNVAVDALIYGLPAVCVDGAAAAICPPSLSPDVRPLSQMLRAQFLNNLAWFQWAPYEAPHIWPVLHELVSC